MAGNALPAHGPGTVADGSVLRRSHGWRAVFLLNLLICVVALIAARLAVADEPIVIKFSHVLAADTPKGKAATYFARRAAELTHGRVRVEVYPDATLYADKDELEALQLGMVHMLATALSKFRPLGVPEYEAFDLPYLFENIDALHRVTQGPLGEELLARLDPIGIKGLAFWDNGFKSFSANRPLRTPADFRGLTMRIQPSKVLEAQMRALGAVPLSTSYDDAYPALATGAADGTENPHSTFLTSRMQTVQKHMALTNHGYLGYVVITNRKFWLALPFPVRRQLEEAMRQATAFEHRIAREENDKALAILSATNGIEIHSPSADELAAFRRVLQPVHREMAARIGEETIQAIYRATRRP